MLPPNHESQKAMTAGAFPFAWGMGAIPHSQQQARPHIAAVEQTEEADQAHIVDDLDSR